MFKLTRVFLTRQRLQAIGTPMRGRFARVEVGTRGLASSLAVGGAGRRRASVLCGLIERSFLLSDDILRFYGEIAWLA